MHEAHLQLFERFCRLYLLITIYVLKQGIGDAKTKYFLQLASFQPFITNNHVRIVNFKLCMVIPETIF